MEIWIRELLTTLRSNPLNTIDLSIKSTVRRHLRDERSINKICTLSTAFFAVSKMLISAIDYL